MHDAHCHPYDLREKLGGALYNGLPRVKRAASAWGEKDFAFNKAEKLEAERNNEPPVFLSFAPHPQLFALDEAAARKSLEMLFNLAAAGELDAVGEAGFDLYDDRFRATEAAQERAFPAILDVALRYNLPLIMHVRRAMHKVFAYKSRLKKARAVVFHSYSGTADEAASLLKAGVNAYFSFGNAILNNHKKAVSACASLPLSRILFETDAPYQTRRGADYSAACDLPLIIAKAAEAQGVSDTSMSYIERVTDEAFRAVFGGNP